MNPSSGPSNRAWAWGMQTVGRAAFIAPDGSPEANYYRSVLDSNLAVQEGFMNITGTGLTPARINSSCASYNPDTANRWDWGRCTVGQCAGNPGLCTTPPLHNIAIGYCPINAIFINTANATDAQAPWMYWYVSVALSHLRELGFVQTQSVVTNTWQRLIEMVQDPTFNPYLIAAYSEPLKKGPAACPGSGSSTTNPFLGSWAQVKKGYSSGLQTINTFNKTSDAWSGNYPCADHGYSLLARAAGTYISGTNSGSFSGSSAWNWLKANVPYSTCGDSIIKYALAPR
jgi:hypothetical protein